MRWRFTISRDLETAETFPDISLWSQSTFGFPYIVPWDDVGTGSPHISFVGATIIPITSSQFLFAEYNFVPGWTYRIEIDLTRVEDETLHQNPRSISLTIRDVSGATAIFTQGYATSEGSGTYAIEFVATADCKIFALRFISGSDRTITIDGVSDIITPTSDTQLQINEPDGWADAQLKLSRDKVYKSLIEFFEGTFLFYGSNGEVDGGFDTILRWEQERGPDATIRIVIEFDAYDDSEWVTLHEGQLDLSQLVQTQIRFLRIPIIRDDFWAKFMSRKSTPVNLRATADLDGASITPIDQIELRLPSQKIRKQYYGYLSQIVTLFDSYGWDVNDYVSFDVDTDIVDELPINHAGSDIVVGRSIIIVAPDNGEYNPDIRIESWVRNILTTDTLPTQSYIEWYIQKNSEAPIALTATDYGTAPYESTVYDISTSIDLIKGDILYLYGLIVGDISGIGGTPAYYIVSMATAVTPSGAGSDSGNYPSYINIIAETTFPETTSEGMLLHDAGAAIINSYGLGVERPFYSRVFGGSRTIARQYASDGCYWNFAVTKGLQLKTYTLAEKPNHMSFDEWWRGVYPIFNVGLSYGIADSETTGGGDVVEWCPEEQPDVLDFEIFNSSSEVLLVWQINPGDPITLLDCDVDGLGSGIPINGVSDIIRFPSEVAFEEGRLHTYQLNVSSIFSFSTEDLQIEVVQINSSDLVIGTHATFGDTSAPISDTFDITINSGTVRLGIRVRFPTGTSNTGTISVDVFEDITECVDEMAGVELIQNGDFDNSLFWDQEDSGDSWTIAGGKASINLFTGGTSKKLTQYIEDSGPGLYAWAFSYEASNISIGPDSINLSIDFYDADENNLASEAVFITADGAAVLSSTFSSPVPVASVRIIASMNSGDDIIIDIDDVSVSGPRVFNGGLVIEVEPVEEFYDEDFEVLLSGCIIERSYDTEFLAKKITIGYTEWQSEDVRGIDDPQASHVYATPFKKVGEEFDLMSYFVAASLAIESARRRSVAKSEDYKFDNKDLIIAINASVSEEFVPELDERFAVVNNLLNSETRYNLAITPARNILRFKPWFNGGLESYEGNVYKFTGGEGNYDLETQMVEASPECGDEFDGGLLSEKQSLEITDDRVHSAFYYTISNYPLAVEDYIRIRDKRKKAIGISQTDSGHVALFIDEMTFVPAMGIANITGWTKVRLDLVVIESATPTQDCVVSGHSIDPDECGPDSITDEFGSFIVDENGDCITDPDGGLDECPGDAITDEEDEMITDGVECLYL